MKKVLCVWEFGGGLGHVGQLMPVARALRECGCDVTFACRTLPDVAAWLGREGFPFVQAPRMPIFPGASSRPASFASILAAVGFRDGERLWMLVEAWRSLFRLAKPDVLIVNYAPIAQLAARTLGIPSIEIGEGFSIPPHESPFPALLPNDTPPFAEEAATLDTTNELLQRYGAPKLTRLCDVHSSENVFLCTFREFDHYPRRRNADYCGALFSLADGVFPAWKHDGRPKVFAYLKADYPGLEALLSNLGRQALDCVAFISGASPSQRAFAEAAGITVSIEQADLQAAAAGCDLGICHSGPGTTIAFLLQGNPVLLLPMQFEQSLTAMNVQRANLGRWVNSNHSDQQFDNELKLVMESPEIRSAARAFQAKHVGFTPQNLAATIADTAIGLLA